MLEAAGHVDDGARRGGHSYRPEHVLVARIEARAVNGWVPSRVWTRRPGTVTRTFLSATRLTILHSPAGRVMGGHGPTAAREDCRQLAATQTVNPYVVDVLWPDHKLIAVLLSRVELDDQLVIRP